MARVNIDAVLAWAVATKRIHWSKQHELRAAYSEDPVQTLGRVLVAKPAAGKEQPCPLFVQNPALQAAARKTWADRKAKERAAATIITEAISATLRELGHDPEDADLRALVKRELDAAEAARKKAAKTAARAAAAQRNRRNREAPLAELAAHWQD